MSLVLALLAATATASPDLRVLVLPTITLDRSADARAVEEPLRAVFDEGFRDAAEGTYLARRMAVVDREEAADALRAVVGELPCVSSACAHQVARRVEASLWLVAVLVKTYDGCRARATSFDLRRARIEQRLDRDVVPCTPDRVLEVAEDLGQQVADGPRRAHPVALPLTPLTVPDLAIADLDDLDFVVTSTALRTELMGISPARALGTYRRNELALKPNGSGHVMVVRGRTPVSDCDLMRAAGRRPSQDQRLSCDGNWWELAYLAAPVGAVMLTPVLLSDEPSIPIGGLAVALLIGGPLLAITRNRDAIDPTGGEHLVTAAELEELVAEANAALREELGLSEAEVLAARPAPP